mmetsp:Transcript_71625/g.142143  ORF Transcript_71625/g.142143 Transcript_71625/m.142143 type:complete len:224 (-) Transcript_71625:93-764(-)
MRLQADVQVSPRFPKLQETIVAAQGQNRLVSFTFALHLRPMPCHQQLSSSTRGLATESPGIMVLHFTPRLRAIPRLLPSVLGQASCLQTVLKRRLHVLSQDLPSSPRSHATPPTQGQNRLTPFAFNLHLFFSSLFQKQIFFCSAGFPFQFPSTKFGHSMLKDFAILLNSSWREGQTDSVQVVPAIPQDSWHDKEGALKRQKISRAAHTVGRATTATYQATMEW